MPLGCVLSAVRTVFSPKKPNVFHFLQKTEGDPLVRKHSEIYDLFFLLQADFFNRKAILSCFNGSVCSYAKANCRF